jgi:Domain of unknown function (DUF222)
MPGSVRNRGVWVVSELMSALDGYTATDLHGLPETGLLGETETLLEARNRLDGLIALRLQAVDVREVTVSECGRATRAWLVEEQYLSPAEAKRRMWVARRLPAHPQITDLLLAGVITHEHAQVILGCLGKLPADWAAAAETELCAFAAGNDPGLLGRLCAELRVRAGADEDTEAASVRRHAERSLTLNPTIDGMIHLTGMLDPESGAIVAAAIAPLVAAHTGPEDTRSTAQRRADALTDLARAALSHGDLPDHGGERPQIVVTIPYHELRDRLEARQLGHATLNGLQISPETARRLACDANIIPAVLGGPNEILNLGRSRRTFTRAQRRAAALRDNGCVFPRCQAPLSRCELHHGDFWANGGGTDHTTSAYVCPFHHWLVHHTNWTITRNAEGKIEIRRT